MFATSAVKPVLPVEEFDQAAVLLKPVGCRAQVDPLVLHRPPQALDEDVVVATTTSIHADLDPMIEQHPREFFARELRTLVGIEDLGLAEPGERFAQGVDTNPPSGCSTDARNNRRVAQSMIATRYRNP